MLFKFIFFFLLIHISFETKTASVIDKAICNFLNSDAPGEIAQEVFNISDYPWPGEYADCTIEYPSFSNLNGTTAGKWLKNGKVVIGTEYVTGNYTTSCVLVDEENEEYKCTGFEPSIADELFKDIGLNYGVDIEVFWKMTYWFNSFTKNIITDLNNNSFDLIMSAMEGKSSSSWTDENNQTVRRSSLVSFSISYSGVPGVAIMSSKPLPENTTVESCLDLNQEGISILVQAGSMQVVYCKKLYEKATCVESKDMWSDLIQSLLDEEYHALLDVFQYGAGAASHFSELRLLDGSWDDTGIANIALRLSDDESKEDIGIDTGEDNISLVLPIFLIIISILGVFLFFLTIVFVIVTIFFVLKKQRKEGKNNLQQQELELAKDSFSHIKINKKLFSVDSKEIKLLGQIAKGGSESYVYRAEYNNEIVAFKSFMVNTLSRQEYYDEFEKEAEILCSCRHPRVVQCLGVVLEPPKVGLILEFCQNGDLRSYILNRKGEIDIKEKIRFLKQTVEALCFFHKIPLAHRDIKLMNLLLDYKVNIKVTDFGISKILEEGEVNTSQIGTSFFISPEVALGKNYGTPCDIYSFAIVAFIVITENFKPFGENIPTNSIAFEAANNEDTRPVIDEKDFEDCPFFIELIKKCWKGNPKERYTAEEILNIINANSPENS